MSRKNEPTFDQVAEYCLKILIKKRIIEKKEFDWNWKHEFSSFSSLVHEQFKIPSTTFTPIMRQFLFLLTSYIEPSSIVGLGVYVGYTFSWIVRDHDQNNSRKCPKSIVGVDMDTNAINIAKENYKNLKHGSNIKLVNEDALKYLKNRNERIDFLYLDVDSPSSRKAIYKKLLEIALPNMNSGGLIVAHDPCVELFVDDFKSYHTYIEKSPQLTNPVILPIDSCGLSITKFL